MSASGESVFGVVEGFYGKPWSEAERFELFDWMQEWRLNAYLYAPKDDLKHRALWRELYGPVECDRLQGLIRQCAHRGVQFIYALAPGLDLRYSQDSEVQRIHQKLEQLLALGCRHFALLFDDIPPKMEAADAAAFPSFASAQARVANAVFRWVRERSADAIFLFCPTPYCGRMALRGLGGEGYLETIGRELIPEIQVLWTGPEIISRTIEVKDLPIDRIRRKPVLWDNLHANDYDRSRCYCGPYSGRDPQILSQISGILSNPNNEFPVNFVPLRTLALFREGNSDWEARAAFLRALTEWHSHFKTAGSAITFDALRAFADCYYLPHEDGPEANALYQAARKRSSEFRDRAALVREFCQRCPELADRNLFYALSQRIWDLREELDLLDRAMETSAPVFSSDFHLPKTYRGGMVRRLQRLSEQHEDGTFTFHSEP